MNFEGHADFDEFDRTKIVGQPLIQLLAETIECRDEIHEWLPPGLTLLGGKTKAGKSTLAEQIAEEISREKRVLYLALEYNKRVAKGRFERFTNEHQVHIVLEGQMNRMGQGGEKQFDELLSEYNPDLVIVDILAKLKRHNTGHYDAEYQAMSEIKELIDKYDVDCLVLTHSGKPTANDSDDPFDKIIGSTALAGVPDNLMVITNSNGVTKLHTKGRLIFPSEKILEFENGRYAEKKGAGVDLEDEAPLQAQILTIIEQQGPQRVRELAQKLDRSEPQISSACSKLQSKNKIARPDRTKPYKLVELTALREGC